MKWLDRAPSCSSWKSESNVVRYCSPVDGRMHRYFIDYEATFVKDGIVNSYLIEVKPFSQVEKPVAPKSNTAKSQESYRKRIETHQVNCAKWEAAKKWASKTGRKFIILTEKQIPGIKDS
jgi:hypothetical protein